MTVSSSTIKAGPYTGNGVQTSFPFTFKVFSKNDLRVVRTVSGAETDLVVDTDFTVTLNPDQDTSPGGSVVVSPAPATGVIITIVADLEPTQNANLTNYRPDVVEAALDKLTLLVQQLREAVTRSIKVNVSSTTTPDDLLDDINAAVASAAASAASAETDALTATTKAAEAAASAASLTIASQAEAEAGTDNLKSMSPLRVAQAIKKLAPLIQKRQTILQQAAAPLQIGTGLSVNLLAAATPYRVTVPNGVDTNGNVDFVISRTADVTAYWSSLASSATNYLFVDRNTSTGADTGVSSTLQPIMQFGGSISVVNNQHTYDESTGTMYVGNGTVANVVQRTLVGECATNATNVTSVTPYATQGKYAPAYTNTLPGSGVTTTLTHNIGWQPQNFVLELKCLTADNGYAVGDVIRLSGTRPVSTVYTPISIFTTAKTCGFVVGADSSHWLTQNKSGGGNGILTLANWSYRMIASRDV